MMKLQGKKSGKYAGFIGWFEQHDNGWDDIIVIHSDSGSYKRDKYKTIAEFNKDWEDYEEPQEAEPDPGYTVAIIQKLENSIKALDERLKTVEEIMEISGVGFCPIHNQDKPCKDCIGGIIEQIKAQEEEE